MHLFRDVRFPTLLLWQFHPPGVGEPRLDTVAAQQRTRAIRSPEQWARLPAWLRRPAEPAELQRSPQFHHEVP